MSRGHVVELDFLLSRESEKKAAEERAGKLVKPTAAHPPAPEQGVFIRGGGPNLEKDVEGVRPLLMLGTGTGSGSTHSNSPLAFSQAASVPWASMARKGDFNGRGGVFRRPEAEKLSEKPSEDITDAEIDKLSIDELRRYAMQMKAKASKPTLGTTGLSAPAHPITNPQAKQGVTEVNPSRRSPFVRMNGLSEGSPLPMAPSGLAVQHDGPATKSPGMRTPGLQAPRYYQPQKAVGEDAHPMARPSERAGHGSEPNLSLSIPSSREQQPSQSSAFGSPVATYLKMLPHPSENSQRLPNVSQSVQGSGAQMGAVARSVPQTHLPGRPPTAQLTIFYSGLVNVYDDVPADKAEAIMLLAGSGSSWSSSQMNPPSQSAAPLRSNFTAMASSSNSPAQSGPATAVAAVSQPGPTSSPLIPTASMAETLKNTSAELPHARKKSLARFLEKRRDRSRATAPYNNAPAEFGRSDGASPSRERSASPENGPSTRSPSPPKSVNPGGPKFAGGPMVLRAMNRSPSPAQKSGLSLQGRSGTPPTTTSQQTTAQRSQTPPRISQAPQAPPQALPQASPQAPQGSTQLTSSVAYHQKSPKEDIADSRSQQQQRAADRSSQEKISTPEPMDEKPSSPSPHRQ